MRNIINVLEEMGKVVDAGGTEKQKMEFKLKVETILELAQMYPPEAASEAWRCLGDLFRQCSGSFDLRMHVSQKLFKIYMGEQ